MQDTVDQAMVQCLRTPHRHHPRRAPVHRYGVVALVVLAAIPLIAVNAVTARLIPLYAIGVFIGFTISQTGLLLRQLIGRIAHHWF